MRDKLVKKKVKRFDYYQFMVDRKLYGNYLRSRFHSRSNRSEYRNRHDYLVSIGLFNEIKGDPRYDRKNILIPGELVDFNDLVLIAKTEWLD